MDPMDLFHVVVHGPWSMFCIRPKFSSMSNTISFLKRRENGRRLFRSIEFCFKGIHYAVLSIALGKLCCRFNFPFDNCQKTRINFEPVHTKSGQPMYKPVIVTKLNDSTSSRHRPLQLQGWRANCDIQITVDYQGCLEYLDR